MAPLCMAVLVVVGCASSSANRLFSSSPPAVSAPTTQGIEANGAAAFRPGER